MAQKHIMTNLKTKPNKSKIQHRPGTFRSGITAFIAAFAAVAIAVPLSLMAVMPMVRGQVAAQTASLANRAVQVRQADDLLNCVQPGPTQTAAVSAGQVLGASTAQAPEGNVSEGEAGPSAGPTTTTKVLVKKLVNGVLNSNATISDTGQESTNKIKVSNTTTTTVNNDNNIDVSNSNEQSSSTGDAESEQNTKAGATTTGDATNTNSTDLNFSVKN